MTRLIWCQGGNYESAKLAVDNGWWYGFRSDESHHAFNLNPVALIDSKWVKPDWWHHLQVCRGLHPWLATVPDTMSVKELPRTLRQAEQISRYCEQVLIVPKAMGIIGELPRTIGGKPVILGYSIPTGYGSTTLPAVDFLGWPVHLLGGNARYQLGLSNYLSVISIDGNMPWRLARRGIVITERGTAGRTIRELDGEKWPHDGAHLECLRRSLVNLRGYWSRNRIIQWRGKDGKPEVSGV